DGFNTAIVSYGSEDYEFGLRAQALGARFAFVPRAGGYHYRHENSTVSGYLRNARSAGANDARIGLTHPMVLDAVILGLADRPQTLAGRVARELAFDHPRAGDAAAAVLLQAAHVMARLRW